MWHISRIILFGVPIWNVLYQVGYQPAMCGIMAIVKYNVPMGANVWYRGNCVVSWLWGIMELSGVIFSTGATGSMNIDGQTNMKPPIGFRTISQKCSNYCCCNSSGVKSNQWDNLTQSKSAFSTYKGKKEWKHRRASPPPLPLSNSTCFHIWFWKYT